MDILVFVLLGVIVLFSLFVTFRSFGLFNFCALCASISLSWLVLLLTFYLGIFNDKLLIGILMGGSAVGVMYLLDNKYKNFSIYKLPFLLSLFSLIYFILEREIIMGAIYILIAIWLVILFIQKDFKAMSKKIIECCKDW